MSINVFYHVHKKIYTHKKIISLYIYMVKCIKCSILNKIFFFHSIKFLIIFFFVDIFPFPQKKDKVKKNLH
jgi:hypothetical protein